MAQLSQDLHQEEALGQQARKQAPREKSTTRLVSRRQSTATEANSTETDFIARASASVKAALLSLWTRKFLILAAAVLLASALMIAAFTVNPALLPAGVATIVSTIIAAGLSQLAVVGIAATTGTAAAAYLVQDATVPSLPKFSMFSNKAGAEGSLTASAFEAASSTRHHGLSMGSDSADV